MGFLEIVGYVFVAFVGAAFWDAKSPEEIPVRVRSNQRRR